MAYGRSVSVDEHTLRFTRDDRAPVVEAMQALVARGDGKGWVNIMPVVEDEDLIRIPDRSGLAGWFSARGPAVPVATWTPPATGRRPRPAQVGLAHGTGPDALPRLAEEGIVLPTGWTKRQDHAKHGVVADLPGDADLDAVIDWMLTAASQLSAVVAVGRRWQAVVHRPI